MLTQGVVNAWHIGLMFFEWRWYPDGVPLMFFSVHNTKRFDRTDKPGPQAMFPGEKWAMAGFVLANFMG